MELSQKMHLLAICMMRKEVRIVIAEDLIREKKKKKVNT